MLSSRENTVNYMTPLGLHHIMGWGHHYGPAPWINDKQRDDWTSVYYHRADKKGIGFDRTESGSNALGQYSDFVIKKYATIDKCPEKFLLWFHHVDWDYKLKSGNTLWDKLCYRYYLGAASVSDMIKDWNSIQGEVDNDIFIHVKQLLKIQQKEAKWWRNACVLYFQTFSNRPIPGELEKPDKDLLYYKNLDFPFAPH